MSKSEIVITGIIKNARKDYYLGPGNGYVVWGNLYDDIRQRWHDGQHMHTSHVQKLEGDILYTRNSIYKIESWAEQGTV